MVTSMFCFKSAIRVVEDDLSTKLASDNPKESNLGGVRSGDRFGHKFLDIILPSKNCLSISIVEYAVCEVAPSCCKKTFFVQQ
jgi:hypothetical protein